jgi:dienelactone hydrolase
MIDVKRSMDYLESRIDINKDKIGYYGFSYGGFIGPIVTTIENRFQAAVLTVGGLTFRKPFPENDQINYLPRAVTPILMLSGRYDHVFPLETSSKLMFEYLGTPQEHKKQLIYDVGHTGPPRYEIIKESLNWFDIYLGPVEPGS